MKVAFRKNTNVDIALRELDKARTIKSGGSVEIRGDLDGWESYFEAVVEIDGRTDAFRAEVLQKVLKGKQRFTQSEFLSELYRVAGELDKRPRKEFRVVFPLFGDTRLLTKRRKIGGVVINYHPKNETRIYRRVLKERRAIFDHLGPGIRHHVSLAQELPLCFCSIRAVNEADAFEITEGKMHRDLGILALIAPRQQYMIPHNPRYPIARVLIGPFMTVHEKSGKISGGTTWFDEWVEKPPFERFREDRMSKLETQLLKISKGMSKLPWQVNAEVALRKFYRAVSRAGAEDCFLETWRLLEHIACGDQVKGEKLVRRASSFFENHEAMHQLGLSFLIRRNSISHGKTIAADDYESVRFNMLRLIRPMFLHYLTNPFLFECLEEFWEFSDAPNSSEVRKRKLHVIKAAARFCRSTN